jgi:hypothetical protein
MKKIKFQIICPAAPQFRVVAGKTASLQTRIFRFSMLSALSVAACAPPDVETEVVDENVQPVDSRRTTRLGRIKSQNGFGRR